jgi:hypothetical protein
MSNPSARRHYASCLSRGSYALTKTPKINLYTDVALGNDLNPRRYRSFSNLGKAGRPELATEPWCYD